MSPYAVPYNPVNLPAGYNWNVQPAQEENSNTAGKVLGASAVLATIAAGVGIAVDADVMLDVFRSAENIRTDAIAELADIGKGADIFKNLDDFIHESADNILRIAENEGILPNAIQDHIQAMESIAEEIDNDEVKALYEKVLDQYKAGPLEAVKVAEGTDAIENALKALVESKEAQALNVIGDAQHAHVVADNASWLDDAPVDLDRLEANVKDILSGAKEGVEAGGAETATETAPTAAEIAGQLINDTRGLLDVSVEEIMGDPHAFAENITELRSHVFEMLSKNLSLSDLQGSVDELSGKLDDISNVFFNNPDLKPLVDNITALQAELANVADGNLDAVEALNDPDGPARKLPELIEHAKTTHVGKVYMQELSLLRDFGYSPAP